MRFKIAFTDAKVMKITDVKTYNLRYPFVEPFANSRGWMNTRSASVVEICMDAGITGWGEGISVPSRATPHVGW